MKVEFRLIADSHDLLDKPAKREIWEVNMDERRLERIFRVVDRGGSIGDFYRYTHKEILKIIGLLK